MIISLTRHAGDLAAIISSGLRTTVAASVSAGLHAAQRPDVQLVVCDPPPGAHEDLATSLRSASVLCPVLLRHEVDRDAVRLLYGLAGASADIRSSFRRYDDLRERLRSAPRHNDTNATLAILRGRPAANPRLRDFIGVMAILGERPVMQSAVAGALGCSASSLRSWIAAVRRDNASMPSFPVINAHFVGLHYVWRRERLGWNGKAAAAAAGFADGKACGNYLRYHVARTRSRLLRTGGFDAWMTATTQILCGESAARDRSRAIARI
jgi:hypothetical protein